MPWAFEKLSEQPKEEPEKISIPSGTSVNNRFLLELSDAFKGTKTTQNYKPVKRIDFNKLELAYRLDEIVSRCVNFYALQVIGPGWEPIKCSKEDKEFIKEFKERTHLDEKLEDVVRDMCKFGNGWLEKQFNPSTKKFVDVSFVSGKYMDMERDSLGTVLEDQFGDIVSYVFTDRSGNKKRIDTDKMAHFKLFGEGNELATGFIEPLYHLIYDKLNARHGISQAGWRAGNELIHAKVGLPPDTSKGFPGKKPDPAFINQLADYLEDIEGKHKLVTPYFVDVNKIPSETIDWSPFLDLMDSRIVSGFGIPIELILGLGGSSRAN